MTVRSAEAADARATASPALRFGTVALAAVVPLSLPLVWNRLRFNEVGESRLQTGWEVQPLGQLLLLASLATLVSVVAAAALGRRPPLWTLWVGWLGPLAARTWQAVTDLSMSGSEDYADGAGPGYLLLVVGALGFSVLLTLRLLGRRPVLARAVPVVTGVLLVSAAYAETGGFV